mmetsp:Transcript_18097/g.51954  ORF Transcript_18097/g.51954 Transcript_18097/m.51954 type:complete len:196 (+) Transcript_18097:115-702(+)
MNHSDELQPRLVRHPSALSSAASKSPSAQSLSLEHRGNAALSKWTGFVDDTREEQTANVEGMRRPTAKKVNKTLRRWQKRAMYGEPQRARGLPIDSKFKAWYIEQRDRHRVELPEPVLALITEEAVKVLHVIRERYEKVLGPDDDLVAKTDARLKELANKVEFEAVQKEALRDPHPLRTALSRRASLLLPEKGTN